MADDNDLDLDDDEVADLFTDVVSAARAALVAGLGGEVPEGWIDHLWTRLLIEQLASRFGAARQRDGCADLAGWFNVELEESGTRYQLVRER